jgi:hypothetical protein
LYFLSKIFRLGSAMEISQSKSEREIAKNSRGGPTLATAAPSKVNLHGSPESELEYA